MDAQPRPDPGDEVGRQRQKHRAALSDRPVPGRAPGTVGELAEEVRAAMPAGAGPDGVHRLLAERGHSRETIAAVLDCLGLVGQPGAVPLTAVSALAERSAGQQRLRTLAQLEAMLLEE